MDATSNTRLSAETTVMAAAGRPVAAVSTDTNVVAILPWKLATATPDNVAVAVTCTMSVPVGAGVGAAEGVGVTPTINIIAAFKFLKFTLRTPPRKCVGWHECEWVW